MGNNCSIGFCSTYSSTSDDDDHSYAPLIYIPSDANESSSAVEENSFVTVNENENINKVKDQYEILMEMNAMYIHAHRPSSSLSLLSKRNSFCYIILKYVIDFIIPTNNNIINKRANKSRWCINCFTAHGISATRCSNDDSCRKFILLSSIMDSKSINILIKDKNILSIALINWECFVSMRSLGILMNILDKSHMILYPMIDNEKNNYNGNYNFSSTTTIPNGATDQVMIRPYWWTHIGSSYKRAVDIIFQSIEKDNYANIMNKICVYEKSISIHGTNISRFNIQQQLLSIQSKCISIQGFYKISMNHLLENRVVISAQDLQFISSLSNVESLTFDTCLVDKSLDAFPKYLKTLVFKDCKEHSSKCSIKITNLPQGIETLIIQENESVEHHMIISTKSVPKSLQRLCIIYSQPVSLYNSMPHGFPVGLCSLELCMILFDVQEVIFPESITWLSLCQCNFPQSIYFQLPNLLRYLSIEECNIDEICLPSTLNTFKCINNQELANINIPESECDRNNLSSVEIKDCYALEVEKICKFLLSYPQLRRVYVDSSKLCKIKQLPRYIERLSLSKFSIGNMMLTSIKSLRLCNCENVSILHSLPNTLQELDIQGSSVEKLDISSTPILRSLCIRNCSALREIRCSSVLSDMDELILMDLPHLENGFPLNLCSINTLHIDNCPMLHNFYSKCNVKQFVFSGAISKNFNLPKRLQTLKLIEWNPSVEIINRAKTVSFRFSEDLQSLHLEHFHSLQSLLHIPSNLVELKICDCPLLKTIGSSHPAQNQLPESLKVLHIASCPMIDEISNIPNGLTEIKIEGSNPTIPVIPYSSEIIL